jgi:Ca2+-binding RTX toxin-like protein
MARPRPTAASSSTAGQAPTSSPPAAATTGSTSARAGSILRSTGSTAAAGSNDQFALDGDYTGLTLDGTAIQNVEVIALLKGVTGDLADYNLTLDATLVGAGQQMTIWGSTLETALVVNGSASPGNLKFWGGTLGDTLTGGSGDDWFWGGLGADTMTGGSGADTFMYQSIDQSTIGGVDMLVGFDQAVDRIDLPTGVSVSGFAAPTAGTLNAGNLGNDLQAGAGGLGAGQALLFDGNAGDLNGHTFLLVDANGVAGYQVAGDFVFELTPGTPIDQLGLFI